MYASADAAEVSSAEGPSSPDSTGNRSDKDLQEVVVTGSLIPRTQAETATPITVISSEDIQSHGFADIAEALQRASFATGSRQDGQFGGFTQGAKVISMFGLDPSFTKYLIDGRPFADYPALYNGAENFVSISGIPTTLIDHLDVLPGAQSSIYGSDAIAGVVNVVMKKNLDGPVADARYGWTQEGGGTDRRFALGDGLTIGGFNLVAGLQYENTTPIWGYQRSPTSQYYAHGTSPQTAERDYLLFGYYGQANGNSYYFEDPANCANVASQFGHSESLQTRAGRGQYCGTVRSGFSTIGNADEGTQGYLHATQDVNDRLQIFADTLINHDVTRFNVGQHFYASNGDSVPFSYYEDPNLPVNPNVGGPDFMNIQHIFSPEEAGGLNNTMDKDTNNTMRATLGAQGELGSSWRYLADFTYSENKLTESWNLLFAAPLRAYFASLMGPQLGYDSANQAYIYSPDYANFYKPLTPAQYASFDGDAVSHSRTEESLARAQVTNAALFSLPGGNAGLALQFEGGRQGWDYSPDPRYFDGSIFGYTSVGGSGHRTRYAGTAELQLPIVSMLTANVSGRYDDYHLTGGSVDKATYNLGLQFRPLEQLLFRGRYGTAFKSPTLADEFQGKSGSYQTLTDYYLCAKNGYSGANIGNCPQSALSIFGTTSGNTRLAPITAKVWDVGSIWSPLSQLAVTADYIHWAIRNEIAAEDATKLLETEAACRLAQLDINSPTCVAALAQVVRDNLGNIVSLSTPKQNVAQENLGTLVAGFTYKVHAGFVGEFDFTGAYTDILSHNLQRFAGDPVINLLNSPYYSTEFKTKENVSLTWIRDVLSATLYVERYGSTPNDLATLQPVGYATKGAGTLSPWTLCDLSLSYNPVSKVKLTFAMNNVFNKMPPVDHSYPGTSNQPYDEFDYNVYGRTFYLTANYNLGK